MFVLDKYYEITTKIATMTSSNSYFSSVAINFLLIVLMLASFFVLLLLIYLILKCIFILNWRTQSTDLTSSLVQETENVSPSRVTPAYETDIYFMIPNHENAITPSSKKKRTLRNKTELNKHIFNIH